MYEGQRLTELHEEIAHYSEAARRESGTRRDLLRYYVKERDAEIRARVAAQEIGRPTCGCGHRADQHPDGARCVGGECGCTEYFAAGGVELFSGISDAERVYPAKRQASADGGPLTAQEVADLSAAEVAERVYPKRRGTLGFNHWSHHSAHYLPVEGCHLCREGSCSPRP